MKEDDPYTRQYRISAINMGSSILIYIFFMFIVIIGNVFNIYFRIAFSVVYTFAIVMGIMSIFLTKARFKRLNQLRERALQGDASLLAKEQPITDQTALPIPSIIQLKQSRRGLLNIVIVIALALFLLFTLGTVVNFFGFHHGQQHFNVQLFFLFTLGAAVFIFLLAFLLFFLLRRRKLIYKIAVDEQGISSSTHDSTSSIKWSDARLFAILNPNKATAIRFYELSNADTIVRWANMPARSIFGPSKNVDYNEYVNKTQVLPSFITARTSLPLYDLSMEKKR